MSTNVNSFHAMTLRLLNREPKVSDSAKQIVGEAEKRLGVTLPGSFRNWYWRADAIHILAEHSNDDPPISVDCFKIIEWQSRRLLPFRNENQGVCTWAIELDGSENPPVYVDVDSDGKEWQLLASSFSEYVYSCVWDYRMVFHRPALVQAQNAALTDTAHDALHASFLKEVQTHGWPGSTQYRFFNECAAILIWASEQQADWFIGASDADGLEIMLRRVWGLEDLGASLYDITEIGKEVLERLRKAETGPTPPGNAST